MDLRDWNSKSCNKTNTAHTQEFTTLLFTLNFIHDIPKRTSCDEMAGHSTRVHHLRGIHNITFNYR